MRYGACGQEEPVNLLSAEGLRQDVESAEIDNFRAQRLAGRSSNDYDAWAMTALGQAAQQVPPRQLLVTKDRSRTDISNRGKGLVTRGYLNRSQFVRLDCVSQILAIPRQQCGQHHNGW